MKELKTDIAIVAAGAAGLAAAVAAAENGAKVKVFEKASVTGGCGNMATGMLAVESRLQRAKFVGLTREDAFKMFMDYTHWRVDARLVKAYIDKSADTIDWLEAMGVGFAEPAAFFPGSHYTWHLIKGSDGIPGPQSAANMMRILTERARALGVDFHLQTPVKRVLKEGGRVTGLIVEDRSGEQIKVDAGAVVIATGGFGDNPDMIKKYTGYKWGEDLFTHRITGLTGDGIRMAWEAGAGQEPMNMEITYGIPGPGPWGIMGQPSFRQPNLMIDSSGERFVNEELMINPTFMGNAIARQKQRTAFVIFDGAAKEHYEEVGYDFLMLGSPFTEQNLESDIKQAIAQGNTNIFVADSLEGLADSIGVDKATLSDTVEKYNRYCDTGRDEQFHKNARYLRPIRQPKFYAGRYFPTGYGSLGGIKINHKTEVLSKKHEVIPGLYAAGTDACGIYGDSYVFILPGNSLGFAVNSGRMAGENAAEHVGSGAA